MFIEPAAVDTQSQLGNGVMFIDPAIADYQNLAASALPQVEMVVLDSARDGVAQMGEELARRSDISSVCGGSDRLDGECGAGGRLGAGGECKSRFGDDL